VETRPEAGTRDRFRPARPAGQAPGIRSRSLAAGLLLVTPVVLAAVVSFGYTPHPPLAMSIPDRLQPPTLAHPFGTDHFGRDVFSRVMVGSVSAIGAGAFSVLLGGTAGVLLGAAAGYHRGWIEEGLMRLMDGVYAFPAVLFALMVVAVLGPGFGNAVLAIAVVNVPVFARLTRGSYLALREREFVLAARALGATDARIALRHLLPNTTGPLLVQASASFATAILAEAALSYLGLGTQPPFPSWGRMLGEAQTLMFQAPWLAVFPGVAVAWTVLGLNLLGDGLRDLLDPRLK